MIRMHSEKYSDIKTVQTMRGSNSSSSDTSTFLNALGSMWASGILIDWNQLYGEYIPNRISLPTYPFERKRYWIEPVFQNKVQLQQLQEEETKVFLRIIIIKTSKRILILRNMFLIYGRRFLG